MKNYIFVSACVVVCLVISIGVAIKVQASRDSKPSKAQVEVIQVEDDYTKEQKEVLVEMKQMRADIAKAKTEINDTLSALRASAVQKGMDPNCHTTWLPVGDYGPGKNYAVVSGNTNQQPILWGFRSDGLVMWKNP